MPRQRLAYQDTLLPFFGSHFLCSFVPENFYFLLEIIRGTAILISASLKDTCIEESGGRRDKEGEALGHAKRREGYRSPLEQDSQ